MKDLVGNEINIGDQCYYLKAMTKANVALVEIVESAEFMFEEGNYSCDCNKSLFLQQQGFDIDEQPCGDDIEILSYNITLED